MKDPPPNNEPVTNEQLLISSRSPLLLASLRRSSNSQTLAPPIPAEPAAVPVPVIEQESVLDLSINQASSQAPSSSHENAQRRS